MKKIIFATVLLSSCCTVGAQAEETQVYTLERTSNGYIRTNTATGETSNCTEMADQLICRLSADDRLAYETDVAALEAKIDSLEKRLLVLEKTGSPGLKSSPPVAEEQEFQTSLNRMEQFFRRFMGIVKEFQQFGGDAKPVPDRT